MKNSFKERLKDILVAVKRRPSGGSKPNDFTLNYTNLGRAMQESIGGKRK